jgi:hypothetical protein
VTMPCHRVTPFNELVPDETTAMLTQAGPSTYVPVQLY